jgi:hypothetical protein
VYGKRVFSIKKQVVEIMAGARKKESGRESAESFNILLLTIEYIVLLLSLIMDKIGIFQTNLEICSRSTESQHDLHVTIDNLTNYQKGVFCAGVELCNVLPNSIKIFEHDVRVLQSTLKGYMKAHPFHCVEEFAAIGGLSEMYIFIMAVF